MNEISRLLRGECTMIYDVLLFVLSNARRQSRGRLGKPKSFTAFVNSEQELLPEHLIRRILGQVNLVEACNKHLSIKSPGAERKDPHVCA